MAATKYKPCSLLIIFVTGFSLLAYIISNRYSHINKLKRYHFLYFGTTIQVTLGLKERPLPHKTLAKIDELLGHLHYKWHPWRDGELKQLNNKLSSLQPFTASDEAIHIIRLSQKLYKKSDGYFNPAIGKLVAYWGFHNDNPSGKNLSSGIDFIDLKNNLPTPNHIKIHNDSVQNTNKYLQLDCSGFIKADAALKIKDILLDRSISNALINIGGDIYVMGNKANSSWQQAIQPWIIATRSVHNQSFRLVVNDTESITTSGTDARRYTEFKDNQQKLRHHIINPKTGEPAQGFIQVTVIHHDPFLADAASTALLVAGEKNYKKVAKSMGVSKYILATENSVIISDGIKPYIYKE